MRKRIFEVIETSRHDDRLSNVYNFLMIVTIVASLVPLAFKEEYFALEVTDKVCMVIFIIDYLLRLLTADLKLRRGWLSFIIYPFTPMAVLDLLCILPSGRIVSEAFKVFKVFRLQRTLRVLRAFKAVRHSKTFPLIHEVFLRQRYPLIIVGVFAAAYVIISALVMFNIEPYLFDSFWDAIYWSTVSLTTMGYGDISPVTTVGRMVTVVSSMVGIAIIALPSAIITAGVMEIISEKRENKDKKE